MKIKFFVSFDLPFSHLYKANEITHDNEQSDGDNFSGFAWKQNFSLPIFARDEKSMFWLEYEEKSFLVI